jgi:colicin import membrane protein
VNQSVQNVEGCVFPIGPDGQVCGRPVAKNGKSGVGRRPQYCDNPEHTRGRAFAVRRQYDSVAGGTRDSLVQVESAVSERPVTDGHISFGALLARFEESSTRLAEILHRATEVIGTVSDPDAASYEVEQIQREAAVQVAHAHSAQAAAEHEATAARKQAAREAEQRAQADQAAEQALSQVERMKGELAEARNAQSTAEAARDAAQRAAEHHRATIKALERQLDQQYQDHHRELAAIRQYAHDERIALTQQYTDQITTLLATIQQASSHTPSKPAAPKTHAKTKQ